MLLVMLLVGIPIFTINNNYQYKYYCFGFGVIVIPLRNCPSIQQHAQKLQRRRRRRTRTKASVTPAEPSVISIQPTCDCTEKGDDHESGLDIAFIVDDSYDDSATTTDVKSNDETVIRNVHQSIVPPNVWQQYLLPPKRLVQQQQQQQQSFHNSCRYTNVMERIMKFIANQQQTQQSIDVTMRWNCSSTFGTDTMYYDLANQLLGKYFNLQQQQSSSSMTTAQQLPHNHHHHTEEDKNEMMMMKQSIADAMKRFTTFCCISYSKYNDINRKNDSNKYKANINSLSFSIRLQSSYNENDIIKCPVWHVDHVTCRFVQTLYGPCTMFINDDQENRNIYHRICQLLYDPSWENVVFTSPQEQNQFLLTGNNNINRLTKQEQQKHPTTTGCIGQATVGEGIILFGHEWWGNTDTRTVADNNGTSVRRNDATTTMNGRKIPTVHKSPTATSTTQEGRILLVMNVHEGVLE